MFEGRLEGKRAIITGASKGIGRATAIRMAQEGGCVSLISRTKNDLEEVAAIIKRNGGQAYVFSADVYAPYNIRVNACIPSHI